MRYELFISLRYLRAKRREAFISLITLISILGVTISVMTLDVSLSVLTGFEKDLRDRILGFSPHVVITSFGGAIEDPARLAREIEAVEGVEAAEPFVYSQGLVSNRGVVTSVYLRGVRPERVDAVVEIGRYLIEGSFEGLGQPRTVAVPVEDESGETKGTREVRLNGMVVGEQLARQLGVGVGDVVSVFLPAAAPSAIGMVPRARRFVVDGIFSSGMFEYDAGLIYIGLEDAQRLVGLEDAVSGIEVRTSNLDRASTIARRISDTVLEFPYEARDWMQMNRNVFIALRLEKVVYFLVLSLMLVVAGFSILATLIMVVMEKRRDIAILKSMGATDRSIARIFVLKGLVIGLVGTVAGNLCGLGIAWLISRYKLPLPPGVFYTPTVPVEVVPEYFAAVSAAALVVCFLVTLYPASRAARLVPVDVLRYE